VTSPKDAGEFVNKTPNVSIDVGRVLFGQTCSASGDSMRQYVRIRGIADKQRSEGWPLLSVTQGSVMMDRRS
jgi:formylmethanofuran dehydrogenase subunit A